MDLEKWPKNSSTLIKAFENHITQYKRKLQILDSEVRQYESDKTRLKANVDAAFADWTSTSSLESLATLSEACGLLKQRESKHQDQENMIDQKAFDECFKLHLGLTVLVRRESEIRKTRSPGAPTGHQQDARSGSPSVPREHDLHLTGSKSVTNGHPTPPADSGNPGPEPDETAEPSKRPQTTDLNSPAKRPRTCSAIEFSEVYQDGKAQTKYRIVSTTRRGKSRYIILRCEEHPRAFNAKNVLHSACMHLTKKHASELKDKASHNLAQRRFGVEVKNCTEELAQLNNKAVDDALTTRDKMRLEQQIKKVGSTVSTGAKHHQPAGSHRANDDGVERLNTHREEAERTSELREVHNDNDHDWFDNQAAGQLPTTTSRPRQATGPELPPSATGRLMVRLPMPGTQPQPDNAHTAAHEEASVLPSGSRLGIKREYAEFPGAHSAAVDDDEEEEDDDEDVDYGNDDDDEDDDDDLEIIEGPIEIRAANAFHQASSAGVATTGATATTQTSTPGLMFSTSDSGLVDGSNNNEHTTSTFSPMPPSPLHDYRDSGSFFNQHVFGVQNNDLFSLQPNGYQAPQEAMGLGEV